MKRTWEPAGAWVQEPAGATTWEPAGPWVGGRAGAWVGECARAWVGGRSAPSVLLILLSACSAPGAPNIPDQSVIGPPEAAGDHCPREAVTRFAQRWFQVADLDQGKQCNGFIEQDECVIALFRDCTDTISSIPRSWQGSIDKTKKITLARTSESTAGVMARSPTSCSGELKIEVGVPPGAGSTWAKLDCTIPSGQHGGFYFERIEEGIEPFARIEAAMRVKAYIDPPSDDQVPDFAVLERRGEIWALVSTGDDQGGLYTGPINAGELTHHAAVSFRRPSKLLISDDETYALISDGSRLMRLELATMSSTISEQGGRIEDVRLTPNGVLIGVAVGMPGEEETELRYLSASTLARLPTTPKKFDGDLELIVPVHENGSRAIAVLVFNDDTAVKLIDSNFTEIMMPDALPEVPKHAVALPGRQLIGFSGESSQSYFTLRVTDGRVSPKIKVPGGEIISLFFSEEMGRLLIGTKEKKLIPYDVDFDRPLLQKILETPERSDLVRADTSGRMYSLSMEKGVIDPLLQ